MRVIGGRYDGKEEALRIPYDHFVSLERGRFVLGSHSSAWIGRKDPVHACMHAWWDLRLALR